MINLFEETFEGLEKNLSEHSKTNKKAYIPDEREWKLARDENDNGQAIIRLLPDKNGKAWTKMYSHSFGIFNKSRNKKLWYIEDSPSTIGEPCPVSEYWAELGSIGTDEAKEQQKMFSRKVSYITNIYVIKDPANPENEGKVFYWKFGTKLFDKFLSVMNPSEKDLAMGEVAIPLWNALKGANIKLKIKKAAGGFLSYDDTTIMSPSSLFSSREEAEDVIINQTIDLSEFESPSHFKTYEELADKLAFVLGKKDSVLNTTSSRQKESTKNNTDLEDLDDLVETTSVRTKNVETKSIVENEDSDLDLTFLEDL